MHARCSICLADRWTVQPCASCRTSRTCVPCCVRWLSEQGTCPTCRGALIERSGQPVRWRAMARALSAVHARRRSELRRARGRAAAPRWCVALLFAYAWLCAVAVPAGMHLGAVAVALAMGLASERGVEAWRAEADGL